MSSERQKYALNGWPMLALAILMWLAVPSLVAWAAIAHIGSVGFTVVIILDVLLVFGAILVSAGLFTVQPNEARVLVLFGKYVGTVKQEGFHWANPFCVPRGEPIALPKPGKENAYQLGRRPNKYRVSLRARNFETQTLKVNDLRGNPIEIGAVVVWSVRDTAQALFDVDDYENYVRVQSETAVRHLANCYPYDHGGDASDSTTTLRDGTDVISDALRRELQVRLDKAGVVVAETRLTHLAYSPEIAGAMLRRQQAEAIIAARQKIVQGAVSMVEMALTELSSRKVLNLDEERRAAMVSNLLVVLCGERQADPVINTGTLYQ